MLEGNWIRISPAWVGMVMVNILVISFILEMNTNLKQIQIMVKHRLEYLCDAAVFAADDPRERVRESGSVGADERARLVHVGAQLEELKTRTLPGTLHCNLIMSFLYRSHSADGNSSGGGTLRGILSDSESSTNMTMLQLPCRADQASYMETFRNHIAEPSPQFSLRRQHTVLGRGAELAYRLGYSQAWRMVVF